MKTTLLRYSAATAVLFLLWEGASVLLGEELIPSPAAVLRALQEALMNPDLARHAAVSARRLAEALAVAILTGFPLGLLFGHSPKADWLGAPITFITLPLPKIVLLPVFFTVFGLGDASRVLLIALATGFQILVIVREHALKLDPSYERALRSMGASRWERIRHVYLPAALPSLFTALKASAGTAMAVLFLAESFATDCGLGWLIMDAWGFGDNLRMFVGILGMSVLGLFLYAAISLGERLCCSWMKPSS